MSEVTLLINSTQYSGWKTVSIDTSIETLSGTFNLNLTSRTGQNIPVNIKPMDECSVAIDGNVLITGYVDIVNLAIDATTHTIQIVGRDKTSDLIDCSVINGTGQYKNLKLEQIVTRICEPFGISVTTDVTTGDPFVTFNIEQGSTAIEAIQKLCNARQCLAMSDGQGGVLITRAGNAQTGTPLIEGINIKSGTANYDYSQRFSQYVVKGQVQGLDTLDVNSISGNMASAIDPGVIRYRPFVVVADGQANRSDCQKRAAWEYSTRKGRSRRFSISTNGWLEALNQKELWRINRIVFVQSNALAVYDKLLIVGINYSLDESGETTTLSLTSADAYLTAPSLSVDPDLNPYDIGGDE